MRYSCTVGIIHLFSWPCNVPLTCSVLGTSACWNNVFFFFSVALPWTCIIFSIGLHIHSSSWIPLPITGLHLLSTYLLDSRNAGKKERATASRLLILLVSSFELAFYFWFSAWKGRSILRKMWYVSKTYKNEMNSAYSYVLTMLPALQKRTVKTRWCCLFANFISQR